MVARGRGFEDHNEDPVAIGVGQCPVSGGFCGRLAVRKKHRIHDRERMGLHTSRYSGAGNGNELAYLFPRWADSGDRQTTKKSL